MRLYITDQQDVDISFDTVVMSGTEINDIKCHPYIVSSGFDSIIIDTDAKISLAYVPYLLKISKVIPKIHGELTLQSVGILSALYKERAAELRVLFVRDKDTFYKVVEELRTQFQWDTFTV